MAKTRSLSLTASEESSALNGNEPGPQAGSTLQKFQHPMNAIKNFSKKLLKRKTAQQDPSNQALGSAKLDEYNAGGEYTDVSLIVITEFKRYPQV